MLAWSEGTDNGRQKTRNHGYDVVAPGDYLLIIDHLTNLQPAKPKTQIAGAGRRNFFPLVGCPAPAAWPERLLSKSQDAVALADEAWRYD